MKMVKSVLTLAAFAAVLSAGTATAQCCCGAVTYQGCGDAEGAGNYTVMRTRRRVVTEQQEVTRYRTEVSTVMEQKEVQVSRMVRDTTYQEKTYTVRRPVRETTYKTVNYTVRRPVRETKTVMVNVRKPVTEQRTKTVTVNKRERVTETHNRTVRKTVRVPETYTKTVTVRGGHWKSTKKWFLAVRFVESSAHLVRGHVIRALGADRSSPVAARLFAASVLIARFAVAHGFQLAKPKK